jgi:hypothetical protein
VYPNVDWLEGHTVLEGEVIEAESMGCSDEIFKLMERQRLREKWLESLQSL